MTSIQIFNYLTSQFRSFSAKSHNFKICNNISLLVDHGLCNWSSPKNHKNRERLDNTTVPSSAPSTPSYSYDKLNENTGITSKHH